MTYFERLVVQVAAKGMGWSIIMPAAIEGESGVEHKFSVLASNAGVRHAFDIYEDVTEIEVLRTCIKKIDTKVPVSIIRTNKATASAEKLAREYNIRVGFIEDIAPLLTSTLIRNQDIRERTNRAVHVTV